MSVTEAGLDLLSAYSDLTVAQDSLGSGLFNIVDSTSTAAAAAEATDCLLPLLLLLSSCGSSACQPCMEHQFRQNFNSRFQVRDQSLPFVVASHFSVHILDRF